MRNPFERLRLGRNPRCGSSVPAGDSTLEWSRLHSWFHGLLLILSLLAAASGFDARRCWAQSPGDVIDASGFQGGVVVHAGCGDGGLALGIHRLAENSLVHGLANTADQVHRGRARAFDSATQGTLTFSQWDGLQIPFVDDFVNLLVVAEDAALPRAEIDRVLAPGGTAVLVRDGQLETITKSRPAELDDWTHYLYGVDNNAVSKDKAVKPPLYHLKWTGSPRWSRHHDVMSSLSACVSADNKVFYIFDEGSTFSPFLPSRWKLIARDAFNGTILWKRDIDRWYPNLQGLKSGPATLPRRVVAIGDRVYVTLGIEAPVSVLDSRTGETLRVLEGTAGTEEILCDGSTLYLVVDRNPDKEELAGGPVPGLRSWAIREKRIVRFNLEEDAVAWESAFPWVAPLSMAMDDRQVYLYDGTAVRAISKAAGKDVWTSAELPIRSNTSTNFAPSLVVNHGVVVYTGGENPVRDYGSREKMFGLSAETGQTLWEAYHPASGYRSPEDLFVINGMVWSGDVTAHRWAGESGSTGVFYGTDIAGGEAKVEFGADRDAYWFHHRCHPAKATEDYLLISRTGIEFIDIKNQSWNLHHWVRGACLYGIMPANGMVYAPQHPCACYIGGKLYGFNALAAKDEDSVVLQPTPDEARRIEGVASPVPFSADRYEDQWPTYRGDNRRSGATAVPVAESLRQQWSVKLPDVTTPPVIADGKVLLSLKHEQALVALDADSGEQRYRFLPGGRIDSPPSVYGGRIYFGCTDGFLYCLSLENGSLVWKYQAAPTALNHMFFEKLESTHPLHGTVLVRDGRVHAVCGRSMFLDGGMRYLILDANTGEKIVEHVMDDKVPGSGEPLQMHHEFLNMPMAMPDILSCNDDKIFMRFQEFDLEGKRLELDFPRKLYARDEADKGRSFETMTDQKGEDAHVFSGTGFLDDSWWHRTYWIYGKNYGSGWPGYYLAGKSAPAGRILSHDASGIYGWGRMKQYFKWSKPYRFMLYATDFEYEQTWARAVPILVRAMVKAGDRLHLAGPEELVDQEIVQRSISTEETQALLAEQDAAMQGERGAMLLCVDASDGTVRDGWRLPTTPVFDGVAAVRGRLYVALSDGTVMCLGEEGSALERIGEAEIARFNAEAALPAPQARKPKPKPAKQAT